LIVYDDLSNHAVALRQLTLLIRRPPGREAYPGDVFLTHSRLLERAGQLSKKLGGGSLTAIPIIETRGGDVSGLIPTNVISITDGQIHLSNTPANRGIRPSIDISISVSRVGSKAQYNAMREVCKNAKRTYSMYKSYENLQKVSTSPNPEASTAINRGSKLVEFTKQGEYETYTLCTQALAMFALSNNYLDSVDISMVKTYFNTFFNGEFASIYLKNKSLAHILYDFDLLESLLIIGLFENIESDLHAIFSQYEQFLALNVQPRLLLIK
jgi:F-type H+-transporting ATPase subunit alpha